MKFLKKLWKGLVSALKRFWEWLKKLFARKKKGDKEPDSKPPEEPKKPLESVIPQEPSKKVVQADESGLLTVSVQDDHVGFIRTHEVDGVRIVQEHFQSLEHLINCLSKRGNNEVMAAEHSSNSTEWDFSQTRSYHDAVLLMRKGFTKILPQIKEGVSKPVRNLSDSYQRRKSISRPSFSGVAPSVPRHLMGLPDSMLDRKVITRKLTGGGGQCCLLP